MCPLHTERNPDCPPEAHSGPHWRWRALRKRGRLGTARSYWLDTSRLCRVPGRVSRQCPSVWSLRDPEERRSHRSAARRCPSPLLRGPVCLPGGQEVQTSVSRKEKERCLLLVSDVLMRKSVSVWCDEASATFFRFKWTNWICPSLCQEAIFWVLRMMESGSFSHCTSLLAYNEWNLACGVESLPKRGGRHFCLVFSNRLISYISF